MTITIYHNASCGTSRNVIDIVRSAGHEPEIIEYLKTGWTIAQLKKILADSGLRAQDIVRVKGTDAEALGLTQAATAEDVILQAMVEDPKRVNRPIVVTPKGTKLCRPKEEVLSLLP